LNELLTLYKQKGNYDQALFYGLQSREIAEELQAFPLLRNIYRHLSDVYEAKGLYKESLETYRLHKVYSDSVGNVEKVSAIDRLKAEFDFEQQRKDAAQVAALLEKDKFIALNQRNWAMAGGVLLVIIVALIYRGILDRKEKKSKMALTHALIETQEAERKRIAKEMHDGVGQSLLMLKNQMRSHWALPESEMEIIEQTISEVRTISQNLHPYQLERLGLTKALESIVDQLDKHTTLFVSAEIDAIDGLFAPDEEINIYRTVQELFNNILKHSAATSAKLIVEKKQSEILIQVMDNGKGFEYGKSFTKIGSLGLKTLKERVEMLKGEIRYESVDPKGTKVHIKVPVPVGLKAV
jgi:signal transduction histidine kinase